MKTLFCENYGAILDEKIGFLRIAERKLVRPGRKLRLSFPKELRKKFSFNEDNTENTESRNGRTDFNKMDLKAIDIPKKVYLDALEKVVEVGIASIFMI